MPMAREMHWCPFEGCHSTYVRKSHLKEHWLKIRGNGGDEHHRLDNPRWDQLDEAGQLKIHTRPNNLSTEELANRNRATAARFREKNRLEINQTRRNRGQDLQTFANNIRDVAKIAVYALDDVDNSEGRVVRGLYDKDHILDPKTILDLATPPTVSTFLPSSDWSTITPQSQAGVEYDDLKSHLLIEQLPGEREFEAVNKILSPRIPEPQLPRTTRGTISLPWVDRRRHWVRQPSPKRSIGITFRGVKRTQLAEDEDIFRVHDVPRDRALANYLTIAYEIWKPVLVDETLANTQFVLHQDDPIAFTATSSQHALGLILLQTWEDVSITMLKKFTPKYSLAELHLYRTKCDGYAMRDYLDRAWQAGDDDEDEDEDEDDESEDEDEVDP